MLIPYITSVLGGTLRNEFLGTVGCKIQVGAADLTVTQLGRYIHPFTPGANHDVRLQDTYGTLLGSVTINTAGQPSGSFYYGTLSSPVTLYVGVNYYLMCTEDGGGDEWMSIDCNVTTTTAATILVGAYSVGHAVAAPTEYPAGGAHTYGPYSFKYVVPDPESPLANNLASYWKLDETSGTRNDSKGTNHLTDNNTVGYATGKQGNDALFVHANSEYLSCASNSVLQITATSFTISAWVRLATIPAFSSGYSIASKDSNAPSNARDYTLDVYYPGGFRFYIAGGGTYLATSFNPTAGIWYLLVAWFDLSNGQLHLQINDSTIYDSIPGATGTDQSTAQFRIGARQYAGYEDYFDGEIDEVGLWKRVLTPAERTQLYNGGAGITYPFPIGPPPDYTARNKRAMAMGFDALYRTVLPVPDGAISALDRYQLSGKYAGLTAVVPTGLNFRNRTGSRFRFAPSFPC